MLFAAAAASSAIDLLSSLVPSSATAKSNTGVVPANATPFSVSDSATGPSGAQGAGRASSGGGLSPSTFNALLQAQSQSQPVSAKASTALQNLFSSIDSDGDGQISKSEFENALGAGGTNLRMADDVFSKMDKDGDGNVSLDEMASALKPGRRQHHHGRGAGGAGETDPLMQALQGASSQSSTNGEGSTTTTLTYADGTPVTMTQPASASSSGTTSYNLTERLIQRQAQAIAASARQSLSLSA